MVSALNVMCAANHSYSAAIWHAIFTSIVVPNHIDAIYVVSSIKANALKSTLLNRILIHIDLMFFPLQVRATLDIPI